MQESIFNLTKQVKIHIDQKPSQCIHYDITFLGSNELMRNEIMYNQENNIPRKALCQPFFRLI